MYVTFPNQFHLHLYEKSLMVFPTWWKQHLNSWTNKQENNKRESVTETEAEVAKQMQRKQNVCVCISVTQWKRKIFCVFPASFSVLCRKPLLKLLRYISVLYWPLTELNAKLTKQFFPLSSSSQLKKTCEKLEEC